MPFRRFTPRDRDGHAQALAFCRDDQAHGGRLLAFAAAVASGNPALRSSGYQQGESADAALRWAEAAAYDLEVEALRRGADALNRYEPFKPVPTPPSEPTTTPPWTYDDGGRAAAGFTGKTTPRDCVTRAIAIVGGLDYREVYDELFDRQRAWQTTSRCKSAQRRRARGASASPRNGVAHPVWKTYLAHHGWMKQTLMSVGSSARVHLNAGELPDGAFIAQCAKHLVAVKDGVIHDAFDPNEFSNNGRIVYSVWRPPA